MTPSLPDDVLAPCDLTCCDSSSTLHTSGTKSAGRALRAHLTPEIAPPVTVSGRGRRGDDHPGHVVRQGV